MAKKRKRQLLIYRGFEVKGDTQRAEAEAIARNGWHDDDDIVVDPAFASRLRATVERLRKCADVPTELLYKLVVRARIAPARHEFNRKGRMIKKTLAAARALCSAMEALGDPPNVYWADHCDVSLFRKVIRELPNLLRLRDDLDALTAQFGNTKRGIGRPRDHGKPAFQSLMVSLLPDRLQRSGRRMDKEFAELYGMVSGRKQNPESYRRTRRAITAAAHKDRPRCRQVGKNPRLAPV
jgi:hypothetical protein